MQQHSSPWDTIRARLTPARLIVVGLLAGWIALNLLTLDRYPIAGCDEASRSQVAYNIIHTGRFGYDARLGLGGSAANIATNGRLAEIAIALTQLAFGPTLWASRLSSLIAGLVTALVLFKLGEAIANRRTGAVAALVYLLLWRTLYHTHFARPEAWTAAAAVVALWLLWRMIERPTFWNGALAGLAAALVVDFHFLGLSFAAAAGLIVVFVGVRSHRWPMVGAFAAGGALGLIYWLAAHLLPDPSAFMTQVFQVHAQHGATNFAGFSVLGSVVGLGRFYWGEFVGSNGYLDAFPALFFAIGIAGTVLRRDRGSRLTLGYYGLSTLVFTFIAPVKKWYNAMDWVPLLALMVGLALDSLPDLLVKLRTLSRISPQAIRVGLLAPLVVGLLAGDLYLLYKFRSANFYAYSEPLTSVVPPGETLVGPHQFWFARPDQPFVATTVTQWMDVSEGRPFDSAMAQQLYDLIAPAYVVMLPQWECLTAPVPSYDVMAPVIFDHCTPVASSSTQWYPDATLYQCPASTP